MALLESAMLVTWEAATESTSAMESYLRRAAKEGAVQKVASLIERNVVNLLSVDKVRGWVGCVVRGWPTWRMGKRVWLCLINQEHCTTTPNEPVSTPPTY